MKTAQDIMVLIQDTVSVNTETTIAEALKIMLEKNIGAVLVKKDDTIIGIWTERDLMRDVLCADFSVVGTKVSEYMTIDLKTCPATDTVYQLMDKFLGLHHRHLIVEKDGSFIGFISAGDVMRASMQEKSAELKQLNTIASWEYYDNWKMREEELSRR